MSWFRRKARTDRPAEDAVETLETEESLEEPEGTGPWDVEEVPDLGQRVDLGSLRVPVRRGMQITMELERKSRRIVAVNVVLGRTTLQLQAFAAPRSSGLWDELRAELSASITKQAGSVEEQEGPFATELLARLPARTPDGRTATRAARFIGVDGPRWFLRGVLSGEQASDPAVAAELEAVLADVVVVRGHEARAPRDLLGLHLPGKPGQEVPTGAARPTIDLASPRGPEITEVR